VWRRVKGSSSGIQGRAPIFKSKQGCNIPKEYYLKINNKRNNYINSHLYKNPNAGKFQFIKIARQNL